MISILLDFDPPFNYKIECLTCKGGITSAAGTVDSFNHIAKMVTNNHPGHQISVTLVNQPVIQEPIS